MKSSQTVDVKSPDLVGEGLDLLRLPRRTRPVIRLAGQQSLEGGISKVGSSIETCFHHVFHEDQVGNSM